MIPEKPAPDEILEATEEPRFSLEPLFQALLSEASQEEQQATWEFIQDYFRVPAE